MTIKQILATLAIFALATLAEATTYNYSGPVLSTLAPFPGPCGFPPCTNYTGTTSITGSLTTASPLASNIPLGTDISAFTTSFTFADGINTYSSSDPNTRRYKFAAGTDGSGNIVGADLLLEVWESGTNPHAVADRVSLIEFGGGTPDRAVNNFPCGSVGTSPAADTDACLSGVADLSTSQSTAGGATGTWLGGAPSVASVPVPTLSEWTLALLTILVALSAVVAVRANRKV